MVGDPRCMKAYRPKITSALLGLWGRVADLRTSASTRQQFLFLAAHHEFGAHHLCRGFLFVFSLVLKAWAGWARYEVSRPMTVYLRTNLGERHGWSF